ncbi:MAG: hypothetical protein ACOZCP_05130 [Pseudomonadota bacterium]
MKATALLSALLLSPKTLRVRDKGRSAAVFARPRDAVGEDMADSERSAGLRAPGGQ